MLVNMKEMLKDAELHNYAIGSLNTPNLETLRAVIDAAEELGCPIIINMTASVIQNMVLLQWKTLLHL